MWLLRHDGGRRPPWAAMQVHSSSRCGGQAYHRDCASHRVQDWVDRQEVLRPLRMLVLVIVQQVRPLQVNMLRSEPRPFGAHTARPCGPSVLTRPDPPRCVVRYSTALGSSPAHMLLPAVHQKVVWLLCVPGRSQGGAVTHESAIRWSDSEIRSRT